MSLFDRYKKIADRNIDAVFGDKNIETKEDVESPYLPTVFNGLNGEDGINEWIERRKRDYEKRNK